MSPERINPAIGYIVAVGGALLFAMGWEDGVWAPALGGVTLFLVSGVYIALCYGIKALASNDAGVRSQLTAISAAEAQLAAHRAELAADMENWRHTQQTQIQETALAQQRLSGLAQLLDDARQAHARVQEEKAELQRQLDDLAEEHNLLVQETMQDRSDRFTKGRTAGQVSFGRGGAPAARSREHGRSS